MTIRDCIVKALGYLGMNELKEEYKSGEDSHDFLSLAKDVIAEICSDYFPLKTKEKVSSDKDGLIYFNKLSLPVIDVFRVSKNKTALPFMIKYDHIDIGLCGSVEVEYSFMPEITSLDSNLPFCSKIDSRIIGYGIAAEYAVVNSPTEASFFDKRYKEALLRASRVKSERRIKRRNWL